MASWYADGAHHPFYSRNAENLHKWFEHNNLDLAGNEALDALAMAPK